MKHPLQHIKTIHLVSIVVLVLNYAVFKVTDYTVIGTAVLIGKVILYISGVILFFAFRKPFTTLSFYFSLYVFVPLITLLSWLGGMLGVILTSLLLFLFFPQQQSFERDEFVVYKEFQGFLGACCKYEVYERKFFLLEKRIGSFESEEHTFVHPRIIIVGNQKMLQYEQNENDETADEQNLNGIITVEIK